MAHYRCQVRGGVMRVDLKKLLAKARTHVMTEEEQEAQQRSFAYGNAALSNPNVTREMVDRAAEKRKNEKGVK